MTCLNDKHMTLRHLNQGHTKATSGDLAVAGRRGGTSDETMTLLHHAVSQKPSQQGSCARCKAVGVPSYFTRSGAQTCASRWQDAESRAVWRGHGWRFELRASPVRD